MPEALDEGERTQGRNRGDSIGNCVDGEGTLGRLRGDCTGDSVEGEGTLGDSVEVTNYAAIF